MIRIIRVFFVTLVFATIGLAQSTQFTYQGDLQLAGSPANGVFDIEFKLFDALNSGSQVGSTLTRLNVPVTNGTFGVSLDFGSLFPGADRYLEVGVRIAGSGGGFQQLLPRTLVNSTPYAITSANSLQLGGVASSQYVLTTDARMLRAPGTSTFAGISAGNGSASGIGNSAFGNTTGTALTSGHSNAFFGYQAGSVNTNGSGNSFFGRDAGKLNISGGGNSFFGSLAGTNSTGASNSFFGSETGSNNATGISNAFFGRSAGFNNTGGDQNTFIGANSGFQNQTGSRNVAVGYTSGSFLNGDDNTLIGSGTTLSPGSLSFASAIGAGAVANASNSVFLGRSTGEDTVRIPGNLNITGATTMNGNLVFASGGIALFNSNIVLTSLGTTNTNTHLCRNSSNQIAGCTTNLAERGYIDSLTKELNDQKATIKRQQTEIDDLKKKLGSVDALIKAICSANGSAPVCQNRLP